MNKKQLEKANKLIKSINNVEECISNINRLKETSMPLYVTDKVITVDISDEIKPPIIDILTDYYNNILSELEKEFKEL